MDSKEEVNEEELKLTNFSAEDFPLSHDDFLSLEQELGANNAPKFCGGNENVFGNFAGFKESTAFTSLLNTSPPPAKNYAMKNDSQQLEALPSETSDRRTSTWQSKTTPRDPERRARFARTAEILSRSGLFDVTMKTAELLKRNSQVSQELAELKRQTHEFIQDVLSNPENAGLREQQLRQGQQQQQQQLPISDRLNVHTTSRQMSELKHLPTAPISGSMKEEKDPAGENISCSDRKRSRVQVEFVSEPLAFEDVAGSVAKRKKILFAGGS